MKPSSSTLAPSFASPYSSSNEMEFSKLLEKPIENKTSSLSETDVDKSVHLQSKHSSHGSSSHKSGTGKTEGHSKPDTGKTDNHSKPKPDKTDGQSKPDGTNSSESGGDSSSVASLISAAKKMLSFAQTAGKFAPQVIDLSKVIMELEAGTISKSDGASKILQIVGDMLQNTGDRSDSSGASSGVDSSGSSSESDVSSDAGASNSTTVNRVTADTSMDAFVSTPPTSETKRPNGDTRSAQDIINDNPILKNLGNQSGIRDKLNEMVGGQMTTNPDQAYRAVALLTYIKSSLGRDGADRGDIVSDGKIDGFTKDGDARHGTEAGVLQDVTQQGWGYLGQLINHQLPDTKDSHVREDGSNMDNLPWGWQHFGEPILNIVTEIAGAVSK